MVNNFFRVNIRVHWADTDAAGVVWFGNFLRFFEEAEDELFRALGRTRMELMKDFGILMPRVDASCKFRAPARAEEVLEIGIAIESITMRRISYRFEARKVDSRKLICEGSYRVACIRQRTFRGIEFPAKLRGLLKRMDGLVTAQRQETSDR
ncbi:MAG: thioesterase family protein [Vicinamibacterales bacterium]|nr:4-hydroxybenzoyl-CoA thioesterase [Acidobacteriota bacterium]MDP7211232.1 thioesterase family protein [Vicinamibacterales bacterium]HJO16928.1 thioesterase family protein [Vicinamibacterales bacterium]